MNNISTLHNTQPASGGRTPEPEEDGIELTQLIGILVDAKWLIAIITAVAVLIGVCTIYLTQPIYKVDALLRVEKRTGLVEALEQLKEMMQTELPVDAEIRILTSRMVIGEAVDNLHLDVIAKPHHLPFVGAAIARHYSSEENAVSEPWLGGIIPESWLNVAEYAWGGEEIGVNSLQVPTELLGTRLTLIAGQQGRYKLLDAQGHLLLTGEVNQRSAGRSADGQPILLSVSTLKARPGTRFDLVRTPRLEAITGLLGNLTVKEDGKNSGMLNLTLSGPDKQQAERVLNEINDIYVRQNVERSSQEAANTLVFLERQIPEEKLRVDAAVQQLNAYKLQQGSVDLAAETGGVLDNIVSLKAEKQSLEREREELRSRFTAVHPSVKALDAKIALQNKEIALLNQKISTLPDTQQTVLRLTENVGVAKKIYTTLLNNAQELRMAKAGTVGNVRIIDYAVAPKLPFKPKKALIMALAAVLGLFLGIGLAFLRHALYRRGIEDPAVIEDELGVPVYATVPHSDKQVRYEKNHWHKIGSRKVTQFGLLAQEDSKDPAVESLVSLATRLHFAQLKADNKIILISGPSPGIGKSFVSANLATVLATQGKKVLLIDADMRRGHLNRYFDLPRDNGLSSYISGEIELKAAIQKTRVSNVYFISTGEIPPNPVELLLHERFSDALTRLNQVFDHIIIDSAPVLAVTDATVIGRLAGVTLMVIKSGLHPLRELEQAFKRFRHEGIDVRGAVFNDVNIISGYGGYGHGNYVYQYAYDSTPDTDKGKKKAEAA